ncbi:MAG: phage tail tape measure protein [Methylocystis sp.]
MTTSSDPFPDPFNEPGANAPLATPDLRTTKLLLDQINVSAANVSKTLQLGFGSASASGRGFNDVLSQIARSLAQIALREGSKALAQGLVGGLSGLFSGVFGSAGNASHLAQGGIIASPTYFAAGGAIGLMGERGAEAIMPLARGPDGRLGVVAQSAAARPVSITVNIAAQDVESFRSSEAQIAGALARAVARGQRNL